MFGVAVVLLRDPDELARDAIGALYIKRFEQDWIFMRTLENIMHGKNGGFAFFLATIQFYVRTCV